MAVTQGHQIRSRGTRYCPFFGLVHFRPFSGNNYGPSPLDEVRRLHSVWRGWLIAREAGVAEHFQPVRVRFANQKFGGTLANPLGPLTPPEAPLVEEELEQVQVVWSQMTAEKEVTAQPPSPGPVGTQRPTDRRADSSRRGRG